jgi:hypothetical protein
MQATPVRALPIKLAVKILEIQPQTALRKRNGESLD